MTRDIRDDGRHCVIRNAIVVGLRAHGFKVELDGLDRRVGEYTLATKRGRVLATLDLDDIANRIIEAEGKLRP